MLKYLVLIALCLFAASSFASGRDPALVTSTTQFESAGKKVPVDVLAPANIEKGKKLPAVILVHGLDGLKGSFLDYKKYAKDMAGHGYIVLIPHFFDSTNTNVLDPSKMIGELSKNALVWLKVLQDTVDFAAKQPEIDDKRIGLMSFSIGSYLALTVAALDKRVAAVVEYFGGAFPGLDQILSKRPPILILHGDADKIINVDEAKKLATICTGGDVENDMKIYKGAGHGFYGPDDEDARRRAFEWFEKWMPAETVKKPK